MNAELGFQQAKHFGDGRVSGNVFFDQQAQPPHAVASVKGVVERGVRGEDAVLTFLSILPCLLALVHAHHGEGHALDLDVASQRFLVSVKQELPHPLANDCDFSSVVEVPLVDVPSFRDDDGVNVFVHRHVAVHPARGGLNPMRHVVASTPSPELVARGHRQQACRVGFEVLHIGRGQLDRPAARIAFVGNARRHAPHEGTVLHPIPHV